MPPTELDAGPAAEPVRNVFIAASRSPGAAEDRGWRTASAGKARLAALLPAAVAEMAPFYIVDPAGNLLYANDAYARLTDRLPGNAALFAPLPPTIVAEIVA